jgi:hypothetical protein
MIGFELTIAQFMDFLHLKMFFFFLFAMGLSKYLLY